MKCRNKCGKEAVGRSMYCSDACKVAYNRNKPKAETVTDVTKSATVTLTMHERQCAVNNQTRDKADQHTINTGKPKPFSELDKGEHNRVSLPGDDDYDGCFHPSLEAAGLNPDCLSILEVTIADPVILNPDFVHTLEVT